jgi:signal transduction histidine kinase
LSFENYQVITASNGREGLELALKHLPDLIVSDIMMPELDGYGLLLTLREHKSTMLIPFIFLTSRTEYTDLRRGMSYGADDYLVKPFNPKDLLDAVRIRLERQAEANRRTEQQINALRNSVVTMMPHELRTPLTGIMGYVDLLLNDFENFDSEEVLRMLQSIQKSSSRLYRLVQNYLLFAQLEIIGLAPEKLALITQYQGMRTADPIKVLTQIAHAKAAQYDREADLSVQVEPGNPHILTEDLQKVAEELVDNAFKFSWQGTPVVIKGQAEQGSYRIYISDQGRGMQLDDLKKIGGMIQFDRHIQEQQGSGLGLIIARRLTEIYGGEFFIESEPQKGTVVCLVFAMT